jgi:hypothetical protein
VHARNLVRRWKAVRQDVRRSIALRFVSDRDYLRGLYFSKFGRWPDLERPAGFNEKIIVKILSDRRPFMTLFADKLRVRDYVRSTTPDLDRRRFTGGRVGPTRCHSTSRPTHS